MISWFSSGIVEILMRDLDQLSSFIWLWFSCSRGHIWNLNEGFWSKFIFHIQTNRTCRGYRVLYIIHVTLLHQYHTPMTISSKFSVIFGFLWHHLHFISFSFILSRFCVATQCMEARRAHPLFSQTQKPFKCQGFIKTIYTNYLPLDKQSAALSHTKWKNHFDWQCGQKRSINSTDELLSWASILGNVHNALNSLIRVSSHPVR